MLTESERRGALVVAALLALGAGYDLWRARVVPPAGGDAASGAAVHASAPVHPAAVVAPTDSSPRALDLNTASAADLERLPGIGPTLAGRIVAHRRAHGRFRETDELLAVRGIGPRLLSRIAPLVRTGPGAPGTSPAAGPGQGAHPPRR